MSPITELSGPIGALAGWLATYAIHSTMLLALAALVAPQLRSDAWRETLWRTALLGALLTATVQAVVGFTPLVGRWTVEQAATSLPPAANEGPAETLTLGEIPPPDQATQESATPSAGPTQAAETTQPTGTEASTAERARGLDQRPTRNRLISLIVAMWILLAMVLLGRVGWRQVRLFQALRGRRSIREGPLAEMLAELRRSAGVWKPVRLSASAVCPTPIALGWFEISVPERFVTDLEPNQQRSALAHELAHLVRRDPVWELLAGLLEALFFFQPLNRIARHRLRDAAENLSDDWAVRQTGSPLSLARCLTDIASWVGAGSEALATGTIAMAEGGPPLLRRVRRLAERDEPEPHASRLRFAGAAGLLAFMATAAPAISLGGPRVVAGQDVDEILGRGDPATLQTSERSLENHAETTPPDSAILPDTVIVHPNPSASLADRWQWALERDLPDGVWIAWGVDGPAGETVVIGDRAVVVEDRRISSNSRGAPEGPGLRSLGELLPDADEPLPNVAFLFGFPGEGDRSGDVAWIRLRSADAPVDLTGRSLVWLGGASTRESLGLLRHIYQSVEAPDLKQEIAAALTLHQEQEVVLQAVRDMLDAEDHPEIRAEAVQWLPRMHAGTETIVRALLTVALEDPAKQVRLEAVDAIANLDSEEARRALVEIVEAHPEMEARSEAAQALVRQSR